MAVGAAVVVLGLAVDIGYGVSEGGVPAQIYAHVTPEGRTVVSGAEAQRARLDLQNIDDEVKTPMVVGVYRDEPNGHTDMAKVLTATGDCYVTTDHRIQLARLTQWPWGGDFCDFTYAADSAPSTARIDMKQWFIPIAPAWIGSSLSWREVG